VLIRRFIQELGGEGLAIACKGMGIGKSDFVSLFLLARQARPGEKIVDPAETAGTVALFDRINADTAQKVLSRWRLDPDYLYALRQVETADSASAGQEPATEPPPKSRRTAAA
jgi:hypothetical protein